MTNVRCNSCDEVIPVKETKRPLSVMCDHCGRTQLLLAPIPEMDALPPSDSKPSPRRNQQGFFRDKNGYPRLGRILVISILLITALVFLLVSFREVPVGYKGVVVGSPSGPSTEELGEGWHFVPLTNVEFIRYNTQVRDMTSSQNSGLTVRSSDNLNIEMDVALVFHLPGDRVADIRFQLGDHMEVVDRYLRNVPRNIASNYTGEFLGGNGRVSVEQAIRVQLTAELAPYGIVVEDFLIRSVDLPASVDQAIEAKQAAEQAVLRAEFERQAIVIKALGESERLSIEAQGFANATVIRANGTAEAIRLVIDQLRISDPQLVNATEAYLTMLYIQALSDPNSNISFIIVPADGAPVIIDTGGP